LTAHCHYYRCLNIYGPQANFNYSAVFALLGLLSPANRGFLATAILLISAVFGAIGGYVSSRVYKAFGGEAWKRNIVMTPLLIPGFIFGVFFLLNLFVWAKGSSGAVPFGTMLALLLIWFVISVPLSVVGSWIGFRQAVCFILSSGPFSVPLANAHTDRSLSLSSPWKARPKPTKFPVRCP
jgi:hypothetical protein